MKKILQRREVVHFLLHQRDDLMVVAGLGAPAWDITAAGDHPLSFPLWGAMGGAVMIGFGLALAQPKRNVLVVTGDGEMLMGLGSLAVIGAHKPPNLSVVVLDNEHYGETGMQKTVTGLGVDLVGMAQSAGLVQSMLVTNKADLEDLKIEIYKKGKARSGTLFAQVKVSSEKLPLVLPPREGAYLKNRFRIALLGSEKALA
jgi:thiamine pyrophosphate-dependent acetolactate synthase large subunit-like protein